MSSPIHHAPVVYLDFDGCVNYLTDCDRAEEHGWLYVPENTVYNFTGIPMEMCVDLEAISALQALTRHHSVFSCSSWESDIPIVLSALFGVHLCGSVELANDGDKATAIANHIQATGHTSFIVCDDELPRDQWAVKRLEQLAHTLGQSIPPLYPVGEVAPGISGLAPADYRRIEGLIGR